MTATALADQVKRAGVVGAGGGGFPTHVKLSAKADTVIANGAECEPLLHKDGVVMEHYAADIVTGMQAVMESVGAKNGVIGIKAKNKHAVDAIQAACKGTPVRVHLLGDYYPAGDEYCLVNEVTGRLIPPQGIPIQVGCVVCNVETLFNIAAATKGKPVTEKFITLAGAMNTPATMVVPVGTTFRDAIDAAGGLSTKDVVICLGGLMMGQTTEDLDTPITKTSTGAVILPRSHKIIQRKLTPPKSRSLINKSACDQCRYCTEFCPRFLLGYAVEPHQVMRGHGFTSMGTQVWNQWAALCCSCGLCTLYSCPESLFPKEACDVAKDAMRAANVKWSGSPNVKLHPLQDGRRVPIKSLMRKMAVADYNHPAPLIDFTVKAKQLILPLKQAAGVPNKPLVKVGDRVKAGQPLGEIPEGSLGAIIHAPIDGVVASVTDRIVLTRAS